MCVCVLNTLQLRYLPYLSYSMRLFAQITQPNLDMYVPNSAISIPATLILFKGKYFPSSLRPFVLSVISHYHTYVEQPRQKSSY